MAQVNSVKDLMAGVRQGRFTSLGSYPIFFLTADGGTLDPRTVKQELSIISRATRDYHSKRGGDPSWAIVGYDVNWEDPDMYDDHTGKRIPSAYAEDDAEDGAAERHASGNNPRTTRKKRPAKKRPAKKRPSKKRPSKKRPSKKAGSKKRPSKKRPSKKVARSGPTPKERELKRRMGKLVGRK